MPDIDLLSPPTTDLTSAPDLSSALADATGEGGIDLLVVDAAHLAPLAEMGVELPADAEALLTGDELVDLTRTEGSQSIARVVGVATPADTDALRRLGARVGRAGAGLARVVVAVSAPDLRPLVEGLVLGGYRSARRGPEGPVAGLEPAGATVVVTGDAALDLDHVTTVTAASLLARNLANTPSNLKDPQWMVERAREVAERRGLEMEVWEEDRLVAEGFGGLLAVGGGSTRPPRLVRLTHGTKGDAPHVVLVGKGITFDTGGINVKPAAGMVSMRTDMSGSAVVLSVIDAVAALELPVHLTVLLPLAENTFGEASYRPSDVIAPYGGRRTVEVTNTDAEGRIVLADALAYADDHLEPDVLVDVATLTGAARVALARSMAALFTPDDALAGELSEAGAAVGEPYWRLPLHEEYREYLRSDVADLDNAPGKVGAVTAALFLQEFVGERRWAHLDIAGPGRSDHDTGLLSVGATGYGARTLLSWLTGPRGS